MLGKQLFSKTTLVYLGIAVLAHAAAWFLRDTFFALPVLLAVGATIGVLTYQDLRAGLLLAFFETFIGGHGHLLDASLFGFTLSLRLAIFAGVMMGWGILFLRHKVKPTFFLQRDLPWILLGFGILIGAVIGIAQNPFSLAFDDLNSYASIAYLLPLISLPWKQDDRRALIQTIVAAGIWLMATTLLLSFLFTHLPGKVNHELYTFVRDSRLAEITLQTASNSAGLITSPTTAMLLGTDGYWYRIFMPSQFFLIVILLLCASVTLSLYKKERLPEVLMLLMIGSFAGLFLSYSRSFLLGTACAFLFIIPLIWWFERSKITFMLKRLSWIILCACMGLCVAWMSIAFPLPTQPNLQDAAFYSTSADTTRGMAIASRWQLLPPLMDAIAKSPVIGSGFGEEVTYISADPRILATNPTGAYSTFRFEWGYQDIWLKMGIIGLISFLVYCLTVAQTAWFTLRVHGYKWIVFGLSASLAALFVTHVFSPYLNHPIGIVTMLCILPFLDYSGLLQSRIDHHERKTKMLPQLHPMKPVVTREH